MGKCESSRRDINEGKLIPGSCAGEQFLWDVEPRVTEAGDKEGGQLGKAGL